MLNNIFINTLHFRDVKITIKTFKGSFEFKSRGTIIYTLLTIPLAVLRLVWLRRKITLLDGRAVTTGFWFLPAVIDEIMQWINEIQYN